MMILGESTFDSQAESIQLKLEAFIDAAMRSNDTYTTTQLHEMVQAELASIATASNTLTEGVFGRWATGIDEDEMQRIADQVKRGITSESERKAALENIDSLIDNSNRVLTTSDFTQFIITFAAGSFTSGISTIVRTVMRLSTSERRKAFRESLYALRAEIVAMKLK